MIKKMAPTLCSLPVEVIQIIAKLLSHKDICNFRLVSKELEAKIFDYFSYYYFALFKTDLSLKSMKDLEDLSNDKHLHRSVRYLLIQCKPTGPIWPANTVGSTLGGGFTWNRDPAGHLTGPQKCLEVFYRLLIEKLVNCKSISINSQWDPADKGGEIPGPGILTALDALTLVFSMISDKGLEIKSFAFNLRRGCESLDRLDIQQTKTPKFLKSWANLQVS